MATSLKLCDICRDINLKDYFYEGKYPGTVELGPYQDIAKKDHCPLCSLVIQALNGHSRGHWEVGIYPVEVCYLGRCSGRSSLPALDVWFDSTSETLPHALSYVWGHSKGLTSTKTNIQHLQKDGALRELRHELPRAIEDAIDLTIAMEEKYLWVDALCIIQDDNRSKAAYIPRMDQIYGNAFLTLVALCSQGSGSKLPGVSHPRGLAQSSVEIDGLQMVPRLPPLSSVIQKSTWNSRAWTFQEGLLSRRCLYFTENQIFWQCRTSYQSEDCPDELAGDQHESDLAPSRMLHNLHKKTGIDPRSQFNVYESLVKQYSPRALTCDADALPAFSGLLTALAELFDWRFASALPESLFDLALLWRPMFLATMRPRRSSVPKTPSVACTSPTWCWTAWHGDIFWDPWRLDSYVGNRVIISTELTGIWLQESGSLRQIKRAASFNPNDNLTSYTAGEETPVEAPVIFEAKTINVEAYEILAPQLDQCAVWDGDLAGGGISNYFRNHTSFCSWIYDAGGKHCGTLTGLRPDVWSAQCDSSSRHDLVLLSRSSQREVMQAAVQDFQEYLPPEYPTAREYYEEIFDTRHYIYKDNWALNIMLVRWENGLAERVVVGQMHADAWNEDHQESSLITLV
ncbi:heterokaryon incompatibility protein-domain-containing protein [Apiospora marii]|uniref:heterokaryon incompatibility protein-domain-containing protein n=1 Tax=Apiospora marii TaxID=335849 RepID=UPI003131F511